MSAEADKGAVMAQKGGNALAELACSGGVSAQNRFSYLMKLWDSNSVWLTQKAYGNWIGNTYEMQYRVCLIYKQLSCCTEIVSLMYYSAWFGAVIAAVRNAIYR